MNFADWVEFNSIRTDQAQVRELVAGLDRRIDVLARHYDEPIAPAALPKAMPPPLPVEKKAPPQRVRSWYEEGSGEVESETSKIPEAPPMPAPKMEQTPARDQDAQTPPEPPANQESLELRVGTYWMSRLGIVILLTGLVFLGNYAYHRIVPLLGAWGKLSLIALAGGVLAGLGAYLERSRETMRNYGRVLLAGGAATIYYTVYAAHFVDALRVIEDPRIGGGLLLALTSAFMWVADRRKSEAVAVPAVLLAYYTSAINAIGGFTLFSNLLLTAAAVIFLARHRWTRLSFASLTATYGSYAFWHHEHLVQTGGAPTAYGLGLTFLACYWVLFTAAVFVAAPEAMSGKMRGTFLTLNNAAFFLYGAAHFEEHRPGAFWIFAVSFGGVLLALAAVAARVRSAERVLDGSYLAQGLGALTLGFCAKFTGPQLAVVLAVESAALYTLSTRRHGWIYEIASTACAAVAVAITLLQVDTGSVSPFALSLPVALILGATGWWAKRLHGNADRFSLRACLFTTVALLLVGQLLWKTVPISRLPSAYAALAAVSLLATLIRLPEIALPGQAFLGIGIAVFLARWQDLATQPAWSPLPLLAITLGAMHWWPRQRGIEMQREFRELCEWALAGAAGAIGLCWMRGFLHGDAWLVVPSLAALAALIYAIATRALPLAVVSQGFTVVSMFVFTGKLATGHPAWAAALVPVLNVALTPRLPLGRSLPEGQPPVPGFGPRDVAAGYRLLASAMFAGWGFEYVAPEWRVAFFAAMGVLHLTAGALTNHSGRSNIGALYAAAALGLFWMRVGVGVTAPDLPAILIIPITLRLSRRLANGTPLATEFRNGLVGAAMASLWLWVTRWTVWHGYEQNLTVAWAGLALLIFAGGLGLRERIYRIGGFSVLGLAICRLFFADVWKFDALARIVSFLALGVVLLVLSFVYHRFAETFRRWL